MSADTTNPTIPTPRKEQEFEDFLKLLEEGTAGHWVEIARAIGVTKDTITAWKDHPRARAIRSKAIADALTKMQEVGVKDWRMWEAKLKLLQVSGTEHVDLTTDGQKLEPVVIYKPEKKQEGEA